MFLEKIKANLKKPRVYLILILFFCVVWVFIKSGNSIPIIFTVNQATLSRLFPFILLIIFIKIAFFPRPKETTFSVAAPISIILAAMFFLIQSTNTSTSKMQTIQVLNTHNCELARTLTPSKMGGGFTLNDFRETFYLQNIDFVLDTYGIQIAGNLFTAIAKMEAANNLILFIKELNTQDNIANLYREEKSKQLTSLSQEIDDLICSKVMPELDKKVNVLASSSYKSFFENFFRQYFN